MAAFLSLFDAPELLALLRPLPRGLSRLMRSQGRPVELALRRIDPVFAADEAWIAKVDETVREAAADVLIQFNRGSLTREAAMHRLMFFLGESRLQALLRLDRVFLGTLMNGARTNFVSATLARRYALYRTNTAREQRRPLDPLRWLQRQTSRTGAAAEMTELYGPLWREQLRRVVNSHIAREADFLTAMDNLLAPKMRWYERQAPRWRLFEDFEELRRQQGNRLGDFLEIDHLFEFRFWRWVFDDVDYERQLPSLLVPRNETVAAWMREHWGSPLYVYLHHVKTRELRRLIPNGTEWLWTTQQWWDAHVHVLTKLHVPQEVIESLTPVFRQVAKARNQRFVPQFNIPQTHFERPSWRPLARGPRPPMLLRN
jgi:hypothetical protein